MNEKSVASSILLAASTILSCFSAQAESRLIPHCDPATLIENSHMHQLELQSIEQKDDVTEMKFLYKGITRLKRAKADGRRVISNLSKCYKVKYNTTKTLTSYKLEVSATPKTTD